MPEFTEKYELGKKLGKGGNGFVIQARDRISGRQVAVKFLDMKHSWLWPIDPEYGLCPQEVAIGMDLYHENIIRIIETFKDTRYFYVVSPILLRYFHGMF